jgi:hypothetical protein
VSRGGGFASALDFASEMGRIGGKISERRPRNETSPRADRLLTGARHRRHPRHVFERFGAVDESVHWGMEEGYRKGIQHGLQMAQEVDTLIDGGDDEEPEEAAS